MLNLIQHLIKGDVKTKASCATTDEILSQAQNDDTGGVKSGMTYPFLVYRRIRRRS